MMNQRGCPSRRIASEVCIRCWICERSVSGSLSSTSVLRILAGFPDTHLAFAQDGVLPLLVLGELARWPRVVLPVEFAHAGRSRFVEFAEVLGLAIRVVACSHEIVPLIQRIECFHMYQDIAPYQGPRVGTHCAPVMIDPKSFHG